jgi:hypothetical protein
MVSNWLVVLVSFVSAIVIGWLPDIWVRLDWELAARLAHWSADMANDAIACCCAWIFGAEYLPRAMHATTSLSVSGQYDWFLPSKTRAYGHGNVNGFVSETTALPSA